ncbi:MAG: phage tail protein [Candidatus Sedimenticola sp. (ex Thyasira tokunagai)]
MLKRLLVLLTAVVTLSGCVTKEYVRNEIEFSQTRLQAQLEQQIILSQPPVGSVIPFPGDLMIVLEGREELMLADGRQLKVIEYPALFAVLGWRHGYGQEEPSKEFFAIPDLRGLFLRGVDGGSKRDPDGASRMDAMSNKVGDQVGSIQQSALAKHAHPISDPGHRHHFADYRQPGPNNAEDGGDVGFRHHGNNTSGAATNTTIRESGNSNESRPINSSVYYLIKVK